MKVIYVDNSIYDGKPNIQLMKMEQDLISFEVAKLAKEKGFDEPTWDYYCGDNPVRSGVLDDGKIKWNSDSDYSGPDVYAAPPQDLLNKWIREKKNLHIEIKVEDSVINPKFYWSIFGRYKDYNTIRCLENSGEGTPKTQEKFLTYAGCLDAALKQALLIEKGSLR